MKKITLALILIASFGSAFAAGSYDGVWYAKELGYISVHEKNGTIVSTRLQSDTNLWEAFVGKLEGNVMTLRSMSQEGFSGIDSVVTVIMTSQTTATLRQNSCRSVNYNYECLLPNNYPINLKKVF